MIRHDQELLAARYNPTSQRRVRDQVARLTPQSARTGPGHRRSGLPAAVLILGSFLPPMDSANRQRAHPHIQKDLGGGTDDIAWISTAYSLAWPCSYH